jgi:MoaA/NifB/PqqE/SkfB family radical SAM enzyme
VTTLDKEKRNIKYLEFELNNQCQYTHAHDWCPRSVLKDEPYQELTTEVITDVMKQFSGFSGSVYFSNYNEPMLDKRIYYLISLAKKLMPKCMVQMYTNGIGMDVETAKRLFESGMGILRMSAYSRMEFARLVEIIEYLRQQGIKNYMEVDDRTYSGWLGHDERIKIYDRQINCSEPCYMPIQYFMICCNGNVIPCFDDWKQTEVFGNVYRDKVDDILMNLARLNMIEDLKQGERIYVPCRGCNRPTELCIQDYRSSLEL